MTTDDAIETGERRKNFEVNGGDGRYQIIRFELLKTVGMSIAID